MDATLPTHLIQGRQEDIHPSFRKFAEDLDRSLVGEFSSEERDLLVDEAIFTLERLADERLILGATLEESVAYALEVYGSKGSIVTAHREGKFEANPSSPLVKFLGRANTAVIGYLGFGTLLYMLLIQISIFEPNGSPLKMPFAPTIVRSIFPEPLPYPDGSIRFYLTVIYPVVAPFVLGWLIGRRVPVKAPSVIYRVLTPITLATFVFGCVLLPNTVGLLFALWQLVFWLPVVALCAYLSSILVRPKASPTS